MSVRIRNVVKEFVDARGQRVRAVDDVSLDVQQGELVTLLGPSGCGKTTTLRMVAGFETPTAGTVELGGVEMTRLPPYKRNVPMVFQSYALFPHLSVRDNAAFGLHTRGVAPAACRQRVDAMASTMGLTDLLDRNPHELSGGQQQRVALLRALVTDPAVLLFDEPLSNLDAQMRVAIRQEIRRVQRQVGFTALYVTHDQAEAMSISDRLVVMEKGRIAQLGAPMEVYARPTSRFVATFLGEANFVPAQVRQAHDDRLHVDSPLGTVWVGRTGQVPGSGRVVLVVRPEALTLVPADAAPGVVQTSVYLGAEAVYQVSVGELSLTARVQNPLARAPLHEGARVQVQLDERSVQALAE